GIKDRTDAQSHQIIGIRQRVSFIEIVDAPGQAAKSVPPCAEACYVQIANRQHGRRLVQLRANFRKQLCPPVKCAAEKLNRTLRHQLVLVRELILHHRNVAADPCLEIFRRRQNIHKSLPPCPDTQIDSECSCC